MPARRRFAAAVFVLSLSLNAPLRAEPILDQSLVPPQPEDALYALINECCAFVGQTYTAGLTGWLTEVRVAVTGHDDRYPLHVGIYGTSDGLPTGEAIGGTTIESASAPLTLPIVFDTPIYQQAGIRYAILVNFAGAPPPGPYQALGHWEGTPGSRLDLYPGGRFVAKYGDSWIPSAYYRNWEDLYFQTIVDPIPEPATMLLVGAGVVAALRRGCRYS